MTNIDIESPAFKSICAYVKAVPHFGPPHGGHGRNWRSDPAGIALLVQQILSIDPNARQVPPLVGKECGFSGQALTMFCRGLGPSNDVWPDLREHLKRLGVRWLKTKADRVVLAERAPSSPVPAPDAAPKAVAPVAERPIAAPQSHSSTLVVTSNGNVEIAKPPAKAVSAVVAGGDHVQAGRVLPRNWRIDPATQDIVVTTTVRLVYGTPEHRKKMMDIALHLGATAQK